MTECAATHGVFDISKRSQGNNNVFPAAHPVPAIVPAKILH